MKIVKPITVKIDLPQDAKLISGKKTTNVSHLEGRSNKTSMTYYHSATDNRIRLEWIVKVKQEKTVSITVTSCKAGSFEKTIELLSE